MESLFNFDDLRVQAEFDPMVYLPDVEKYLKDHAPKRIPPTEANRFSKESLAQLPDMGWLNGVELWLVYPESPDYEAQRIQLGAFLAMLRAEAVRLPSEACSLFPQGYNELLISLDTETTGLDTRVMYGYDGKLIVPTEIVGLSLATSETKGYYLPIAHTEEDGIPNWRKEVVMEFVDYVHKQFAVIYHNSQYDREILALNGVSSYRTYPYFFDTQIISFTHNVNNKMTGLKYLSGELLGRKMIKIEELFGEEKSEAVLNFTRLPATCAHVYAGSDALNTYKLFNYYGLMSTEKGNVFRLQPIILQIDHKMVDCLRDLYRQGLPVILDYFIWSAKDIVYRMELMQEVLYKIVGRPFDISSPREVSKILFDEFKIPPPEKLVVGKAGYLSTGEEVLDALYAEHSEYPVLRYIVLYRKLGSTLSKFSANVILSSYTCALMPYTHVQLQFNQTNVPTGRFSSSSSGGTVHNIVVKESKKTGKLTYKYERGTGDCGFNSQGIPAHQYRTAKAKRILRIPPEAGIDLEFPYPKAIHQKFIKAVAGKD